REESDHCARRGGSRRFKRGETLKGPPSPKQAVRTPAGPRAVFFFTRRLRNSDCRAHHRSSTNDCRIKNETCSSRSSRFRYFGFWIIRFAFRPSPASARG